MKNYLSVFYAQIFDSNAALINGTIAATSEECALLADSFASGLNPPGSAGRPQQIFFLMNKSVLTQIIQSVAFQLDPLNNPYIFSLDRKVAENWGTESDTWQFDSADPPAVKAQEIAKEVLKSSKVATKINLSGAPTLFDQVQLIKDFGLQLAKQGKLREAGIVLYAYNRIIDQTFSVTEAFDYLRKSGILT